MTLTKTKRTSFILFSSAIVLMLSCFVKAENIESNAWRAMLTLAADFNDRKAGSVSEKNAGNWLVSEFQKLGFSVKTHDFTFNLNKQTLSSRNFEITLKGTSPKTILIGAHYDAVPSVDGSSGLADNASGAATLLGLAENLKNKTHFYTIRLVLFGAEEVGLQGAKHYVNSQAVDKQDLVGMINLDTVLGGDNLYIHSAHSKPYKCDYVSSKGANKPEYSYGTQLRDSLLASANRSQLSELYSMHPTTKDYPAGETGSWSDHAPFACLGLPIAYIEATNFSINGEDGFDGYSQTTKEDFWTCFNDKKLTACNRKKEKNWGKIWHTKFDQASYLVSNLGPQIKVQFHANIELLTQSILNGSLDKVLHHKSSKGK